MNFAFFAALTISREGRLPRRPQLIRDAVERVPPRKIGRRSTGRQVADQNSQVGCSTRIQSGIAVRGGSRSRLADDIQVLIAEPDSARHSVRAAG